ncbi:MAG TPA: DNA repair protein RadC [Saprospiraceae bacterium]|nr:DNA repair protein RadC [Saprospiraceae bacterium]
MKPPGIKDLQEGDQPRYKMVNHGPQALSDAELLAILLRTGNRELSAIGLAQHLLGICGGSLAAVGRKTINDLCRIKGIGEAKAVEILAAIEMGKRHYVKERILDKGIRSAEDAYWHLSPVLMDLNTEEFWILLCNRANIVTDRVRISSGGIHGTVVDVKVVLRLALEHGASALVLGHNHPSGGLTPSEEDKRLTSKLTEAARLMDIRILDHLIIAGNSYFSFLEADLL